MSFATKIEQDARLRILQTLVEQTDHRMSDRLLVHALDSWGHRRSLDFVRTQMRRLAELGAVTLPEDTETLLVAEITMAGRDHVARRGIISGVLRPDPGE